MLRLHSPMILLNSLWHLSPLERSEVLNLRNKRENYKLYMLGEEEKFNGAPASSWSVLPTVITSYYSKSQFQPNLSFLKVWWHNKPSLLCLNSITDQSPYCSLPQFHPSPKVLCGQLPQVIYILISISQQTQVVCVCIVWW